MSRYWALLVLHASRFTNIDPRTTSSPTHILKERHDVPADWSRIRRADEKHEFRLEIGVKQRDFDGLEKRLLEISDPSHRSYGKHLSMQEVHDFISPADETIDKLHEWLEWHGVNRDQLQYSQSRDWITVPKITISKAESLLQTNYHVYRRDGQEVIRAEEWSLPADLHSLIDTIHPTNSFFNVRSDNSANSDIPSRPTISMNHYAEDLPDGLAILNGIDVANPPLDLTPEQVCNITAVTPLCLRTLYGTLNYTAKSTHNNKMALCNFSGQFNNRSDARQYLSVYRPDAVSAADNFGIVEIAGGVNRQLPSTEEQIKEGLGKEGGLDAQVLLGVGHPTPMITYTTGGAPPPFAPDSSAVENDNEPFLTFINWLLKQTDLPTVLSISYADTEYTVPPSYAQRVCQGFAQLSARGVSVIFGSGDWGVGNPTQCHDKKGNLRFAARFPDSCPYITSVAATRGIHPQEVGYNENNHFMSGGGFSEYFPRPKWQDDAVSAYIAKLGGLHNGLYIANGRAYPDVAAMGYRIVTVWNGKTKVVDGTSASAPAFAAIVALLNDARLAAGKPALGFLNPWIYKVGLQGGFHDVVKGNTRGCNTTGFPAMKGWDMASGFGTPWFPRLKELALGEEKKSSPWYIPSWLHR